MNDTDYLESTIKQIVEDLKTKKCLSQDFCFLTKAEREQALKTFMDNFIKTDDWEPVR